jgi:hypothetical protein
VSVSVKNEFISVLRQPVQTNSPAAHRRSTPSAHLPLQALPRAAAHHQAASATAGPTSARCCSRARLPSAGSPPTLLIQAQHAPLPSHQTRPASAHSAAPHAVLLQPRAQAPTRSWPRPLAAAGPCANHRPHHRPPTHQAAPSLALATTLLRPLQNRKPAPAALHARAQLPSSAATAAVAPRARIWPHHGLLKLCLHSINSAHTTAIPHSKSATAAPHHQHSIYARLAASQFASLSTSRASSASLHFAHTFPSAKSPQTGQHTGPPGPNRNQTGRQQGGNRTGAKPGARPDGPAQDPVQPAP